MAPFRGEHVALLTGLSGDKVRVTHTAQVRLEQALEAAARRAAVDRTGSLPADAITRAIGAAVAAGELDFQAEPEHAAALRHQVARGGPVTPAEDHLRALRVDAELSRREMEATAARQIAIRPTGPSGPNV